MTYYVIHTKCGTDYFADWDRVFIRYEKAKCSKANNEIIIPMSERRLKERCPDPDNALAKAHMRFATQ